MAKTYRRDFDQFERKKRMNTRRDKRSFYQAGQSQNERSRITHSRARENDQDDLRQA